MNISAVSRPLASFLVAVALASAGAANAASIEATDQAAGDLCSVPGCSLNGITGGTNTMAWGLLSVPTTVNFFDNFGTNTSSSAVVTTDNFTFAVPLVNAGVTVTGEQIDLNQFAVTGTLDSVTLYAVASNGALIQVATGNAQSPLTQALLDPAVTGGNYELQIIATLAANATGGYSGVFVAQPVATPLPPSVWLMASALLGLGLVSRRRMAALRR